MVEEGARVAGNAANGGAKTIAEGAELWRAEAGRFADKTNWREPAGRAADEAKRRAKDAGKTIRDAAGDAGKIIRNAGPAGKKAGEVFDDAKSYVSTAAKVAGKSVRVTRASAAATAGIIKAKDWVKE